MSSDSVAEDRAGSSGTRAEDLEWLFLDGHSAGFFRIGDELRAGRVVGRTSSGVSLRVTGDSTVVGVEYDWESDQLILVVGPSKASVSRRAASRTAARPDSHRARSGNRFPQAGGLG